MEGPDGHGLRSVNVVNEGDLVQIHLLDGTLDAQVVNKKPVPQ